MDLRPDHGRWKAAPARATVPPSLIPWLTDPASLTARIRQRCQHFAVALCYQGPGKALRDEALALRLRRGERLWVREVLLLADQQPVVFARSLLPRHHVRGAWNLFHGFGARPLGAALFSDPAIRRGMLACIRLDRRDARYHRARALLAAAHPALVMPATLWGRRSLFSRQQRALLVSEFFLPSILDLPREPQR